MYPRFRDALTELLTKHEISRRELSRRMQRRFGTGSNTTISFLENGQLETVSAEYFEQMASVLNVDPSVFTEYRMVRLRDQLNPTKVGFNAAATALAAFEAAWEEFEETI